MFSPGTLQKPGLDLSREPKSIVLGLKTLPLVLLKELVNLLIDLHAPYSY
jgi:hypothetical protein